MSDEYKEEPFQEENAGGEKPKKSKSRSTKASGEAIKKPSDKTKRRKDRKGEGEGGEGEGGESKSSKSGSRRRKNSSANETDKPKRPKSKGSRSKLTTTDTSSPPSQPPSEPPSQPPSEPPASPPVAQTEEEKKFLELMAQKQAGGGGMKNMNLTPIRRVEEEEEPKGGKKRSFFGFRGKRKKEAVVGGVIEGSVKHEGHAGFQSGGGLSFSGLPPQLAEFFEKLNDLFHKLGYEGVTQQEVTFVLSTYGDVLLPNNQPPKPAVKVVEEPAPEDLSREELLVRFNNQAAVLSGLKATHTTIQTAKEKMRAEVDELHAQLEDERKELSEMREKNTSLEVEVARLRAGGATEGEGSDAFAQLEARMKEKLDEVNARLKAEQERTKELQAALNEYADEKTELVARLGESQEVMRQQLTASKRGVSDDVMTAPSPGVPSAPIPPPPPPPDAPPLNFPPDHAPPPPGGGGIGGGLDLSGVTLKKAPAPTQTKSTTADLLAQIRQGNPGLKKVEDAPKKDLPTDDSNVLNIIFNALVERRNAVTGNDEEESEDDWDDSDCE